MSLNSDFAQSTPITILRDTGASQSLILADTLPFSEKTSSGTSVLIQGVQCGFVNVLLHNIYLSSDLVNGLVAVGIRQALPFKAVHLLLGNDLAGDKVVVNPLVTDMHCIDQSLDPVEQDWLVGWLFWVLRPFETVFQSISGLLPKRGRKRRKDR